MSDASDTSIKKGTGARVTLRLSEGELTALRELAEARDIAARNVEPKDILSLLNKVTFQTVDATVRDFDGRHDIDGEGRISVGQEKH